MCFLRPRRKPSLLIGAEKKSTTTRSMMIASAITAQMAIGYMPPLPARKRAAIWSNKEPDAVASAASSVSLVRSPTVIDASELASDSAHGAADHAGTLDYSGGWKLHPTSRTQQPVKNPR